jgi:hypothetical protein
MLHLVRATTCGKDFPFVRRVIYRIRVLKIARAFGAMRRSLPSFEVPNPWNFRSSGRVAALFASLTFSLKPIGQEQAQGSRYPLAGAATANVDVAVVGMPREAETPSGQFLVEIVKHEVA